MILSIGPQLLSAWHLDHICDLCKKKFSPDILIDISINTNYTNPKRACKQLVICYTCLRKLSKCADNYLGTLLLLGADATEEVIEL